MVLESNQQPVKRGRGRPRKTPLPETTSETTTRKSPGRPKKVVKKAIDDTHLTREEELAAFERRSNKSGVLTLLVLLLGIALVGYGMYLKLNQAAPQSDNTPSQIVTDDKKSDTKQNPSEGQQQNNQAEDPANGDPSIIPQDGSIFADYFSRVNRGETGSLSQLQDSSFNTVSTLRTYFNPARLTTFVNNTVDGIAIHDMKAVTDDPVLQRNPEARVFDFTMVYTLKSDGKEYREAWRGYTVLRNSVTVINGMLYQGASVADSPFFQFSKFGIK